MAPVVFEGNPGALWGLRSKSTHPAQGGSTLTHTPLSGTPPPRAFMSHTRVSLYEFWGDMNIRSKQVWSGRGHCLNKDWKEVRGEPCRCVGNEPIGESDQQVQMACGVSASRLSETLPRPVGLVA